MISRISIPSVKIMIVMINVSFEISKIAFRTYLVQMSFQSGLGAEQRDDSVRSSNSPPPLSTRLYNKAIKKWQWMQKCQLVYNWADHLRISLSILLQNNIKGSVFLSNSSVLLTCPDWNQIHRPSVSFFNKLYILHIG